jgi:hypothetical protein
MSDIIHSQVDPPSNNSKRGRSRAILVIEDLDEDVAADEAVDIMVEAELTGGVHDLIEEDAEARLFQPLGQEVLAAEGELVDVGLEEDAVDSDGGLAVGPHPLIRHYVHEEPPAATSDGVVFDDLDAHGGLAVDRQQGDSHRHEVPLLLEQPRPEAVLSDGQIQDGVLDVTVAVMVSERLVEGQQVVFLGDDFEIGEEGVLGSLKRNTEILQEIECLIEGIPSGFDLAIDGVGLIIVLEVYVKVVDGGEVADEVVYA